MMQAEEGKNQIMKFVQLNSHHSTVAMAALCQKLDLEKADTEHILEPCIHRANYED
jgi:hypothetical protein